MFCSLGNTSLLSLSETLYVRLSNTSQKLATLTTTLMHLTQWRQMRTVGVMSPVLNLLRKCLLQTAVGFYISSSMLPFAVRAQYCTKQKAAAARELLLLSLLKWVGIAEHDSIHLDKAKSIMWHQILTLPLFYYTSRNQRTIYHEIYFSFRHQSSQ